jgi:gliding motility-associated-like protein
MKAKLIMVLLLFLVLTNAGKYLAAQNSVTICAGQKGIKYQVIGDLGSVFHWMVAGGQIVSDPNANIITVNWGNEPGNYKITVYEEKTTGCLGNTKEMNVELQPATIVDLGNDVSLCEGGQVEFNAGENTDINQNKYSWQDGSTDTKFVASTSGIYWLEATNLIGCSFRDSVILVVNPLPKINLGNDSLLCEPDELVLDAGSFGGYYEWSNGENSQTITAHENEGKIWVKVTDSKGCSSSDTIQILSCLELSDLLIPKAFTPNSGTTGSLWIIGGAENYPNISVKIYNRWSILIYKSEMGYHKPWDGTSNGKDLPMDAYYYIINTGDGSKDIVGSVTIIR